MVHKSLSPSYLTFLYQDLLFLKRDQAGNGFLTIRRGGGDVMFALDPYLGGLMISEKLSPFMG